VRRTERLHALTKEIRRRAPASVSAAWLADPPRGQPAHRRAGPDGATQHRPAVAVRRWSTRRQRPAPRAVLPPLNLTAAQTTALLLSLTVTDGMPYSTAARSAANKLHALPSEFGVRASFAGGRAKQIEPG